MRKRLQELNFSEYGMGFCGRRPTIINLI